MAKLDLESPVALAMYEAASRFRKEEGERAYLGMSSIGDRCARKIWYAFRGYTPRPTEGRVQMIFSLGSAVEQEVLRWLRLGGYEVDGQQTEFSALNGYFKGHCDGIVHKVTKRPHVLEIKSASASRFKAFKTSGVVAVSTTYAAQLQCYMGYSGLDRGIWVIMNKDTCELYVERAHFIPQAFQTVEAKARDIITANVPPAQAYRKGSWECRQCDYSEHCWNPPGLQERPTCGTCRHCLFKQNGPQAWCTQVDKPLKVWGGSCAQWAFWPGMDEVPF